MVEISTGDVSRGSVCEANAGREDAVPVEQDLEHPALVGGASRGQCPSVSPRLTHV